jgi:predicted phage tail protein
MSTFKERQIHDIEGAGGKGGGGGGGSDAADTLEVNEFIKMLHLIGEGEVNLYTGDGRSIFFNNVPLENSDGSYNFGGWDQIKNAETAYYGAGSTYWEWRNGAPTQTAMTNPAFPSASTIFSVNTQILGGTTTPYVAPAPVIYAVEQATTDYCLVALSFPNGIINVDSKGNIIGDSVEITIDVKEHSSSTWTNVIYRTINDKSSNGAVIQFQVNNPVPGNLWDIRVSRLTQDNSSAVRKNQVYLDTVQEVQQVNLTYDGIAYCGLALDAATYGGSGGSIPTISFLVQRGPIAIPSNFNPDTHVFSGTWDGTFTTGVTDDPAWVLYDILTNSQYGLGIYGITEAMIDKDSFYNASVFNSALVSDGNGGQEPRFTFNAPIQNRQSIFTTLQQIAGMMNANIGYVNGLITLFQDQPTVSKYLINKSRVVGTGNSNSPVYFKYQSNELSERVTSVNVTWVNASNQAWLPTTTSVTDSAGLSRYGYMTTDLAAFGATSIGQAHRAGAYWLYENLYNNEIVDFTMPLEGLICQVDDVFDLYDDDYAGRATGGRLVSATSNTVTLDQPVIIDSGVTSYIWILAADGVTYTKYTITNGPGTYSDLTISGTFSTIPSKHCPYGVVSSIAPRTFKIKDIKIDVETKTAEIQARLYDSSNYNYVEGTYTAPTAVYTQPDISAPSAPSNLVTVPTQAINPVNNQLVYGVLVEWDRPASQNISYVVKYRKDNGQYITSAPFATDSFELTPIVDGQYQFLVYSVNIAGLQSPPASISYTLDTTGGSTTTNLADVTGLEIVGTSGTTWTGFDCAFQWTNPTANQGLVKDFVVTIATTGGTQLRQVVCPGVNGGNIQSYIYHFADNEADGLNRSLKVTVQCRDSQNDLTAGTTATFTNPSPAVPSDISAETGLQQAIISWTPETQTDLAGYMVWWSTTNGFTPSSSNASDLGNMALASFTNLQKNTTYYYRVAAYDVFGKSLDGTGMNVSSQLSTTTPSNIGVPSGASNPTSGMTQGDLFFNTTDNTIYRYTGSTWTNATDGSTIDPASITTNQIAAGTILGSNIAAGTIVGNNIAASTITASLMDVASLSAITANVGTLTAGTINNNSGTNVLNLSATGSQAFISTPQLTITAAGNATFSGALSAATGTFSGSLSAATGTFAGSLSAASGTFTGNLSGASGTFSGSLTARTITASNIVQGATSTVATYSAYTTGSPVGLEIAQSSSAPLFSATFTGAYTTLINVRVNFYAGNSTMDCQVNLLIDGNVVDSAYDKLYGSGTTPRQTSVSLSAYVSDSNEHTVEVVGINNSGSGYNYWYSMPFMSILRLLS